MEFTRVNFAEKSLTATHFFPLIWKTVAILEDHCKLKVMEVTLDEASTNRAM